MSNFFEDFYGQTVNDLKVTGIARRDRVTREPIWLLSCTKCRATGQTAKHKDLKRKTVTCANAACGKVVSVARCNGGTAVITVTNSARTEAERHKEYVFPSARQAVVALIRQFPDFNPSLPNRRQLAEWLDRHEMRANDVRHLTLAYKSLKEAGLLQP